MTSGGGSRKSPARARRSSRLTQCAACSWLSAARAVLGGAAFAQHGHEFVAGGEDRLRVGQRDAARFGQMHAARGADEQRLAEAALEQADLRRQRRLGDVQLLRGTGEVAGLGDDTEVVEMVVIELRHDGASRLIVRFDGTIP